MKKNIRKTDVIGRIGREEFLVMLKDIDVHDTYRIAEQLRVIIGDLKWYKFSHPVTISVGVYYTSNSDTIHDVLEKADSCYIRLKMKAEIEKFSILYFEGFFFLNRRHINTRN